MTTYTNQNQQLNLNQQPTNYPAYPVYQNPQYGIPQSYPPNGQSEQPFRAHNASPIIVITSPDESNTVRTNSASESSRNMKTDHNDRNDFMRKVYGLLTFQLAITAVFVGVVSGVESLREGIRYTFPIVFVCIFLAIILLLVIFCTKKFSRKYPYNYIALIVFTLLESYIIAFVCAYSDPMVVLAAAVMTLSITTGLTIYAWRAKKDFTVFGGMMIVLIMAAFWLGIFMIFVYSRFLYLIYAFIVVIIFGFYIIYDTQLIAGGRYQELTYDDYVIGSLLLYVDIVGLFLLLLCLCGTNKN